MTKRIGARKSVIRRKQIKARKHLKEVAERRAQRKIMKQVHSLEQQYNRMNHSVFRDNRTFKRLQPQVEHVLKIKKPNYNQRQHIRAVIRDYNSHETTSFKGSRSIYRATVKTIYNFENKRHGNRWKPLFNKDIITPQSVHKARKFWGSYHKLNDLLESEHGSRHVFDSDTKLTYLTGHVSGTSSDIAMSAFKDLLHSATPHTGIIL